MPQTRPSLNGGENAFVADRIELFYESFPQGRIITELVSRTDGEITFTASVYRSASDVEPSATGWAAERENDGDVNTVACLENTETSAIGRALANLGFTAAKRRSSAEDILRAGRAHSSGASPLGIGTRPPDPPSFPDALAPATDAPVAGSEHLAGPEGISDILALLDTAERGGYPAERARAVRQRIATGDVPASSLLRVERGLRRWLAQRDTHRAC